TDGPKGPMERPQARGAIRTCSRCRGPGEGPQVVRRPVRCPPRTGYAKVAPPPMRQTSYPEFIGEARQGQAGAFYYGAVMAERATFRVKTGLAEMLKGGVIMDVTTAEQAKVAEDAGACA